MTSTASTWSNDATESSASSVLGASDSKRMTSGRLSKTACVNCKPASTAFRDHPWVLRVGSPQHHIGGVLVPISGPPSFDALSNRRQGKDDTRHLVCTQHHCLSVRGAQVQVGTGGSAVAVAGEPAFADQALVTAAGLNRDNCLVVCLVAVTCLGGVMARHERCTLRPQGLGDPDLEGAPTGGGASRVCAGAWAAGPGGGERNSSPVTCWGGPARLALPEDVGRLLGGWLVSAVRIARTGDRGR